MKNKLKKTLGAIALYCLCSIGFAQNSSGEIKGLVVDDEFKPAIGAEVKAMQAGVVIKNAVTDADGKYSLKPLQPGTYEVLVIYPTYKTTRYSNVTVESEEASYVDVELEVNVLGDVNIYATKTWEKPLVDKSYITSHQINFDQISKMPVTKGDISGMIANISSDIIVTDNGAIFSRGSRVGSSKYYVDGDVLPFDTEVTGMAIQNMTVITGGIPAQYGDLTGAAIVVTTRDYFSGAAEQNIRNNNYKQRKEQEKKEAEYEAQKKKREQEIQDEKNKKAQAQPVKTN